MAVSRRYHPKTKTGCGQCKSHKKKCDEEKPICLGCIRRGENCSYLTSDNKATKSTDVEYPVQSPYMLELGLMHHYSIWTFKTFGESSISTEWWQVTLPKLAFRDRTLLDALFSYTGLHIASNKAPDYNFYVHAGLRYREKVLKTILKNLSELSIEKAESTFWSSVLLGFTTLALHPYGEFQDAKSTCIELSQHWRGLSAINKEGTSLTGRDFVAKLAVKTGHSIATGNMLSLKALREARGFIEGSAFEKPRTEHYLQALDKLECIFLALEAKVSYGLLLEWLPCLPNDILNDIAINKPAAAVLYLLFGVVLDQLKDCWYINNLGGKLVQEASLVCLDELKGLGNCSSLIELVYAHT